MFSFSFSLRKKFTKIFAPVLIPILAFIFLLGSLFLLYLYFQTTTTQEGFSFVFDKDRTVNDGTYNIPGPASTAAGATGAQNPGNGDQTHSANTPGPGSGTTDDDTSSNPETEETVDKTSLPASDPLYNFRRFLTYQI